MKAFLVTSSGRGGVSDVAAPVLIPGMAVIDVSRAGLCGTDVGLFTADDARVRHVKSTWPLRLGHEWAGVVSAVAPGVDPEWVGRRVTGDTMLGCGHCDLCLSGNHHVCEERFEVGVRGGWAGAFAEQLLAPITSLHRLPDGVSDAAGAMVEPGGNSYRAVQAAEVSAGSRVLVLGPGTIGLLCALFARAAGAAEVHLLGRRAESLHLARSLGFEGSTSPSDLPQTPWDSVIDASNSPDMPAFAAEIVRPAGRVVWIGISSGPSLVDSRALVRKDITAVGILGGSAGLGPTIDAYATRAVDPLPLIAETISLDRLESELAGRMSRAATAPPKVQVDPKL